MRTPLLYRKGNLCFPGSWNSELNESNGKVPASLLTMRLEIQQREDFYPYKRAVRHRGHKNSVPLQCAVLVRPYGILLGYASSEFFLQAEIVILLVFWALV